MELLSYLVISICQFFKDAIKEALHAHESYRTDEHLSFDEYGNPAEV